MLSLLSDSTLTSVYDHWKNHSFDYMDLCWQSDISAFNIWSRFIIAFLPRSKHLLVSWLQSLSAVILEPNKIKSITASSSTLDCDRESIHCVKTFKRKNQIFILYFPYKIALLVIGYTDSIVIKDIPTNK